MLDAVSSPTSKAQRSPSLLLQSLTRPRTRPRSPPPPPTPPLRRSSFPASRSGQKSTGRQEGSSRFAEPMVKAAGRIRYEPGPAFQESREDPVLDISPADSTELWLIQWPINKLDASDFHGEEVSLKLQEDGNLGSLDSSSGKSYELVSFAAQQPDATVFLPSGSEMKAVGKISRRVCLVRYPESEELEKEKPSFGSVTLGSRKSAASSRKTMSQFTSAMKNHSSQGSAFSLGQQSPERTPKHKQKRKEENSSGHSNASPKSSKGYQARGVESNRASEMPQASVEKSKKKKKVKIEE